MPALEPTPFFELPITGQTLRLTLGRGDFSSLLDCTRQLRIAGYKVDPYGLANLLLERGCAQVMDAFGHQVSLHVKVPRPEPSSLGQRERNFQMAL